MRSSYWAECSLPLKHWRCDKMTEMILRPKTGDREAYIQAMWLLFMFAPSKPAPEPDGMYNLGEIGSVTNKNWTRLTPYSPTEGKWKG